MISLFVVVAAAVVDIDIAVVDIDLVEKDNK